MPMSIRLYLDSLQKPKKQKLEAQLYRFSHEKLEWQQRLSQSSRLESSRTNDSIILPKISSRSSNSTEKLPSIPIDSSFHFPTLPPSRYIKTRSDKPIASSQELFITKDMKNFFKKKQRPSSILLNPINGVKKYPIPPVTQNELKPQHMASAYGTYLDRSGFLI